MATVLGGCDFNFFKHVFLDGPHLLKADQLQKREKRYHDFDTRRGSAKQIRKTETSAGSDALQNRIDLFRDTETFAEDFLHVLACFHSFHHSLESTD